MMEACTSKALAIKDIVQEAVAKTEAVWQAAELPVVTTRRAKQMLKDHMEAMFTLRDCPIKKRGESYNRRREDFVAASRLVFDIRPCKCAADGCACDDAIKLQVDARRPFLQDQRTERRLKIGEVAGPPLCARLRTTRASSTSSSPGSSGPASSASSPSPMKRQRLRGEWVDQDFVAPTPRPSRSVDSNRNTSPLPNTAATAARFNVSSRAAAAIASAFAVDSGLVTPTDTKHVVDHSKMRRQQSKVMLEANAAGLRDCDRPTGLYFDGRKNETMVQQDIPGVSKTRHIREKQNHVVLLAEPGSHFIGHVTPAGALAANEARAIIAGLKERAVSTDGFRAAGCDGTSYNTGAREGVLACLEREMRRPL
ncbi:Vacuolar protein sorting/targeting protein 10 [Frankliniella fusca]|uniref:Vacuolar protein sorting/targeting protein 10 n=1 Tax=Frankliniella fusca TaxID=407009 RepID=A0AAE1HGW0_9NEOP|nr:Vacuolar protein sorting/targeting protein 10 [Frankliniella fusca]KAK3918560.1 Vacuolar protein sorting/targeting protein 10 [Frankliniella fusca]KAK3920446.1 Vacuolar protein sorting/targeting protein 10 [Frankliniella fusca]